MGRHEWDFTDTMSERMYFWIMVSSEMYLTSLIGYKVSLILLYLSFFRIHTGFRIWCYAALVFVVGYLTANLITEVAGCTPVQRFWDKSVPGHCIKTTDSEIFYGACNMFTDLWVAILPLPMIARLQLKTRRQKIGVISVLGIGLMYDAQTNTL